MARGSPDRAAFSTVAVVVPSPATSEVLDATSRTIRAPMFSMILAPIVRGRKGAYRKELEKFAQDVYVRVRINGELPLSLFLAFSWLSLQTVKGARCSLLYSLAGGLLGMVNMAGDRPRQTGFRPEI